MVEDQWYAVCETREVKRRPLALRRLGRELVLWRDGAGRIVAAPDRCPHKGAKLSPGRVEDGQLACPYHGFRFDSEGACTHVPVHPHKRIPRAMCLQTLPIEEAHGLVWLWHGEGRPDKPVPWFDDVRSDSPTSSSGAMVFPVHYSRIVESNFDVYHFPFVHRSIDPGLGAEVADLVVKAEDGVIRTKGAIVNAKGRATPFRVDFLPPNVQRLQLTEHVVGVIVSTPIDEENTWVWARYDQTFFPWPFVGRWISAALLMLEWTVVQKLQDIPVLRELDPPKAEPGACVWVEADAGAARYVQWRARQLRRVRAETPLRQVGT